MRMILPIIVGAFWTATYVLLIWRGFADRTYGMPVVALASNICWEFIFTFVHPAGQPQWTVNLLWFLFDVAILVTVVRFGAGEFPGVPRWLFFGGLTATIALAFPAVLFFAEDLDGGHSTYAAFGSNLMMSGLFLAMLYSRWRDRGPGRDPMRGQSVWIGWTKLAGTLCASIMVYVYYPQYDGSKLLVYLYVANFALDAAYVAVLYAVRNAGVSGSLASVP